VIPRWVKKVEDDVKLGQCHVCIVGTKADLVRDDPSRAKVSRQDIATLEQDIRALCGNHPIDFFETSAKDNLGVAAIFDTVARRFHEAEQHGDAVTHGIAPSGATPKEKNGCC